MHKNIDWRNTQIIFLACLASHGFSFRILRQQKIRKLVIGDVSDHFSGRLCQTGVLTKDTVIWLNGARPSNTCIPPSILVKAPGQLHGVPTHKIYHPIQGILKGEVSLYH